ncbi:MAG: exodeoxyribonuclease VII small subunit [bacterium]|nr:exodeoxyribonuclease VII small subunit [bacterium]
MTEEKEKKISFEKALAELEKIVSNMETSQLPLDQMMKNYEKGKKISDYCTKKLQEFEKKIEILVDEKPENGEWGKFDF